MTEHPPEAVIDWEQHRPAITGLVKKLCGKRFSADAEDIVQETMMKLWKNNQEANHAVAMTAAHNLFVDHVRRENRIIRGRGKQRIEFNEAEFQSDDTTPLEQLIVEETRQEVRQKLYRLPQKKRELLEMHFFEDMTYKEIAERNNEPKGSVQSRAYFAQHKFQEIMDVRPS